MDEQVEVRCTGAVRSTSKRGADFEFEFQTDPVDKLVYVGV